MKKEIIGEATLYLGDCREVIPTLETVDAIVTDPPYGMSFQSNFRKEKHIAIANDGDVDLLLWACALQATHSKYIFCRWDNLQDVPRPKSMVTWVKNNWSMGDLHHEHARQTEVALFYPGAKHSFPGSRPTDVIHAPRTANENHPTEKPVFLMQAVIEWTRGVVVDPFMGSGSTGVAAVQMHREFIGIEVEPKHFDTACRRIEAAQRQVSLFEPPPAVKHEQMGLLA
jgi:DNA modification methylase